ncbi:MAG: hypothetical protein Q8M19_06920 [Reyranella sp.]|nr:hypothetical protein [Reyranella sp.]
MGKANRSDIIELKVVDARFSAIAGLEPDIRDSERLAAVIRELFLARCHGVKLQIKEDEHECMMETLLDSLCELTASITKSYYKAAFSNGGI